MTATLYTDAAKTTPTNNVADAIAATVVLTNDGSVVTDEDVQAAVNQDGVASLILEVSGASGENFSTFAATELFDGVTGLVTGSLVPSSDANFVKVTPNVFSIKTEEGTLAVAGAEIHTIGGKECYHLLPVDSRYVEYGDKSFVALDGTVWQIAFTTDIYAGDDLFADYYYERTVDYYPKVVKTFRNALVFANTYEDAFYYPWRVRYTVPGDMTITRDDWYTDLVSIEISGIRDMKTVGTESFTTLGTYLYVYKDDGIIRGSYDPNAFLIYDMAIPEGLYANRTIQTVDEYQYFLGKNDIYVFDGVHRKSLTFDTEMKGTRVRNYLLRTLDPTNLKNTFAVYDRHRRKYILFIKQRGEEFPTEALCYDVDRHHWVRYKFPATSAAIHISMNLAFDIIDSLIGTIDELPGTIDELSGYNTNQLTLYAMTKRVYASWDNMITDKTSNVEDTAVSKTHSIISKDFLFKNLEEAERISMMKFEAYGNSVSVRYSTEYDILWKDFLAIPNHETFALTGKYKTYFYNCDTQADKIRFMFSSTLDFRLRWLQVFAIETTELTEE